MFLRVANTQCLDEWGLDAFIYLSFGNKKICENVEESLGVCEIINLCTYSCQIDGTRVIYYIYILKMERQSEKEGAYKR